MWVCVKTLLWLGVMIMIFWRYWPGTGHCSLLTPLQARYQPTNSSNRKCQRSLSVRTRTDHSKPCISYCMSHNCIDQSQESILIPLSQHYLEEVEAKKKPPAPSKPTVRGRGGKKSWISVCESYCCSLLLYFCMTRRSTISFCFSDQLVGICERSNEFQHIHTLSN